MTFVLGCRGKYRVVYVVQADSDAVVVRSGSEACHPESGHSDDEVARRDDLARDRGNSPELVWVPDTGEFVLLHMGGEESRPS